MAASRGGDAPGLEPPSASSSVGGLTPDPPARTVLVVEDQEQYALPAVAFEATATAVMAGKRGRGVRHLRLPNLHRLLLTDVVMPEHSGPEMVSRLRSSAQDYGVLYMSGYPGSVCCATACRT